MMITDKAVESFIAFWNTEISCEILFYKQLRVKKTAKIVSKNCVKDKDLLIFIKLIRSIKYSSVITAMLPTNWQLGTHFSSNKNLEAFFFQLSPQLQNHRIQSANWFSAICS